MGCGKSGGEEGAHSLVFTQNWEKIARIIRQERGLKSAKRRPRALNLGEPTQVVLL